LKALNFIAMGGVVMNVGLNLYSIPAYGAFGATMATLVTQFSVAVVKINFADKQFNFGHEPGEIAKLVFFAVLTLIFASIASGLQLSWFLTMALSLIVSLIAAMLLKLVPVRPLLALIKSGSA
jgi:peptidoglycan biosynthesis protein MviN/MurJ (putative lipid II flippase)